MEGGRPSGGQARWWQASRACQAPAQPRSVATSRAWALEIRHIGCVGESREPFPTPDGAPAPAVLHWPCSRYFPPAWRWRCRDGPDVREEPTGWDERNTELAHELEISSVGWPATMPREHGPVSRWAAHRTGMNLPYLEGLDLDDHHHAVRVGPGCGGGCTPSACPRAPRLRASSSGRPRSPRSSRPRRSWRRPTPARSYPRPASCCSRRPRRRRWRWRAPKAGPLLRSTFQLGPQPVSDRAASAAEKATTVRTRRHGPSLLGVGAWRPNHGARVQRFAPRRGDARLHQAQDPDAAVDSTIRWLRLSPEDGVLLATVRGRPGGRSEERRRRRQRRRPNKPMACGRRRRAGQRRASSPRDRLPCAGRGRSRSAGPAPPSTELAGYLRKKDPRAPTARSSDPDARPTRPTASSRLRPLTTSRRRRRGSEPDVTAALPTVAATAARGRPRPRSHPRRPRRPAPPGRPNGRWRVRVLSRLQLTRGRTDHHACPPPLRRQAAASRASGSAPAGDRLQVDGGPACGLIELERRSCARPGTGTGSGAASGARSRRARAAGGSSWSRRLKLDRTTSPASWAARA
jgi:hypothetical protein